jgi:hypothetical protein
MPTGKARKSSVIEARRQAAMQQIVARLQGAFGDYVRSQVGAPAPQGPPPGAGAPGANPLAALMAGGGGGPAPNPPIPVAPPGSEVLPPLPIDQMPPTWNDRLDMAQPKFGQNYSMIGDPGFNSPGPQVRFEDGSVGPAMPPPDPGFFSVTPPGWNQPRLPMALLAYIESLRGRGIGPTPDGSGPPVIPQPMMPPGRPF